MDALVAAHAERIGAARFGIVSAVDPMAGMIKVYIQPDDIETGWISDFALSVGDVTVHAPSEIGTQVAVEAMYHQGDEYSVIGKIFDVKATPRKTLATGTVPQPGEFVATLASGDEVYIGSGHVQVTSPQIVLKGAVKVIGPLEVSDTVTAAGEIIGNSVPLSTHTHKVAGDQTEEPDKT